eukprot:g26449.t1
MQDAFLQPNQEALVPQEEAVEFETPISQLSSFRPEDRPLALELETPLEWIKKSVKKDLLVPEGEALKFETPISILFQEDEELEAEELWSDLLAPLLETDAVDTMNESNYLTVTVQKPLGLTVEENSKVAGGGVAVCGLEPNSNAERAGLRTGLQLLAAGGVPVHGMSLEDAIQPIEAAEDQVQLTFFMGSAEAFYGEGKTPQGRTWSWALELLDELRESDETYSNAVVAAMEACQKASRWQPALKLLDDLCASSAAADLRAAYRAAVVTCDRGGEPLRAMWLLEPRLHRGMTSGFPIPSVFIRTQDEMKARSIQPDAATYNSAISSLTSTNWRSSSKSGQEPLSLEPLAPLAGRGLVAAEPRGRRAASPQPAAARRAVSTGGFERKMMKSPSQGSLSTAALVALRS